MTNKINSAADRVVQRLTVHAALRAIIRSVTGDPNLHEDLWQETALHLWKQLQRHPRHRWAWYLRGCKLRVIDLLRKGRSLDALKHRSMLIGIVANDLEGVDDNDPQGEPVQTQDSPLSFIYSRDTFRRLWPRITIIQKTVLLDLFCGLSSRDTARELHTSHQSITYHRKRIAAIALAAGIVPYRAS